MSSEAMYYISQGQFVQALLWVFNNYIGYGIIWVLLGLMIMGTTYKKSKSTAISGFFFALFLGTINVFLPVEVQAWFTLIIAILFFMVLYRVLR